MNAGKVAELWYLLISKIYADKLNLRDNSLRNGLKYEKNYFYAGWVEITGSETGSEPEVV